MNILINEWIDEELTISHKHVEESMLFNPLSPKIHIQILQTDLHTFLLIMVERIWFNIKAFFLW